MSFFNVLICWAFILFLSPSLAIAQFAGKVTPSFVDVTQQFGKVRVSLGQGGTRMIIGAPRDASRFSPRTERGAAYVYHFELGQWQEKIRLAPSIVTSAFANALDITDDWILIGNENDHQTTAARAGAVHSYHFDGTNWNYHALLNPAELEEDARFGASIQINGDLAFIGATGGVNEAGAKSGVVYIFRLLNGSWQIEDKLSVETEGVFWFGQQIAVDDQRILISSTATVNGFSFWPVVYLFEQGASGWEQTEMFHLDQNSNFGFSLTMDGDWLAIGNNLRNGSVHLYREQQDTWEEHAILRAPDDSTRHNGFGASISMHGNRLMVGAPTWSEFQGAAGGKVYEYVYDGVEDEWEPDIEWRENHLEGGSNYGSSVLLQGEMLFIGANGERTDEGGEGAVYVYGEPPVSTSNEIQRPSIESTFSVFPNPMTSRGTISLSSELGGEVEIRVFDMLGREMDVIYKGYLNPGGMLNQDFVTSDWPAGVYLVRAMIDKTTIQRVITSR